MAESCPGAELLMETAVGLGVDVCFANPGTTEMALVAALDKVPGMRSVLCLFEGVCTGAADGYGRMRRTPAMTMLHLGPGFANGIANLHNARRAHSPIINVVGDHASWHVGYDAPLTSDIHSLAKPVSGWVKTVACADAIAPDFADAVAAVLTAPGCNATFILPTDFQEAAVAKRSIATVHVPPRTFHAANVQNIGKKLRSGERCVLLIGGTALTEEGLELTAAIAECTGAKVLVETYPGRVERGRGLPAFGRLPYFPEDVQKAVGDDHVILVGTREPISYFGYEGIPSRLVAPDKLTTLTTVTEDSVGALRQLAEALGASAWRPHAQPAAEVSVNTGKLSAQSIVQLVVRHMPENSIVVPEGSTCSVAFYNAAAHGPRHTVLTNTGGAIGQGPALSVGCAIACPDRKVINLQSDGSALYTVQSLWTQAREKLDVVTLIVSNRRYAILQVELKRSGQAVPGPQAQALTELDNPAIDWVALASGFGVRASRVQTAEELEEQLELAMSTTGPYLIEMVV
jgi:acetolactate synthase-1/2/3 large subunit